MRVMEGMVFKVGDREGFIGRCDRFVFVFLLVRLFSGFAFIYLSRDVLY